MVECDYCGDGFEGEEAYLDHLETAHADELGAIDRRRVASRGAGGDDGLPVKGLLLGGAALTTLVIIVWFAVFMGGGGGDTVDGAEPTGLEDDPLPSRGDERWISQVESFPDEGNQHVESGSEINYAQEPPLSGPHYGQWTNAGFYEEPQAYGNLVHSLEHGAIVIYYDPSALTPETEASLRAWARNHNSQWAGIVVTPNPSDDPQGEYVLTAWRHRLVLDSYDAEAVKAFAAEYIGRGPENPVR